MLQLCIAKGLTIPQLYYRLWIRAAEEFESGVEQPDSLVSTVAVSSNNSNPGPHILMATFCAHMLDGLRGFYSRRMQQSLDSFEQAHALRHTAVGQAVNVAHTFYFCLTLLSGCNCRSATFAALPDGRLMRGQPANSARQ